MLPTVKSSSVLYKLNNIAAKCTKSPVLKTSHLKREWSCHTESAHLCPGWIKKTTLKITLVERKMAVVQVIINWLGLLYTFLLSGRYCCFISAIQKNYCSFSQRNIFSFVTYFKGRILSFASRGNFKDDSIRFARKKIISGKSEWASIIWGQMAIKNTCKSAFKCKQCSPPG